MDRFAAMRVFVGVADAGSLSGAGRRLNLPLATVSRHLAALEEELGVRLLTRTTRRLSLTEPGESYLETCRRVLDDLETAERSLAGEDAEPQGELALTAPVVFGRLHVLPIMVEFLAAYPKVTARMLLVDRVVDYVEEGLDIGVRIGNLPDSSMRAVRVGAIRYVACASPAYLKRRGTPVNPRDLEVHDCISFATFSNAERWSFAGGKPQRVAVKPRLIVNTAEAAIDAAKAGLGIARVLSYQAAAPLAERSLRLIFEDY
jgi:DNA-binding transcriptional LysR family regulator